MTDEKDNKLKLDENNQLDANDYETVSTVDDMEVVGTADDMEVVNKVDDAGSLDFPEETVEDVSVNDGLSQDGLHGGDGMEFDDVEAVDVSPVADGAANAGDVDGALSDEEFDDFEDLEDDTLAAIGATRPQKSSGSKMPVVIGVLALLAAGGAGYYYFTSDANTNTPVAPYAANTAAAPVSENVADATTGSGAGAVPQDDLSTAAQGAAGQGSDTADVNAMDAQPQDVEEADVVLIDGQNDSQDDAYEVANDMLGEPVDVDASVEDQAMADQAMADQVGDQTAEQISEDEAFANVEEDIAAELIEGDSNAAEVNAANIPDAPSNAPEETVEVVGTDDASMPNPNANVEVSTQSRQAEPVGDAFTVSMEDDVAQNTGNIDTAQLNQDVITQAQPQPQNNSRDIDIYFDSIQKINQPSDPLQASGPTAVDPVVEPASKYLIVSNVKSSDSIEAEVMRAKRALKLGRYDAALDYYERLYKRNPKDEAILMGRAVALQKVGRENAAMTAYEELLAKYPKNADALVNMLGLLKSEYPAVALQKLLAIRQDAPENAGVAAQIGLTYASMNNYVDAQRYINIAMGLEPENALLPYNAAVIFDREGDYKKAVEYYEMALRIDAVHGGGRSVNRDVIYDRLTKIR